MKCLFYLLRLGRIDILPATLNLSVLDLAHGLRPDRCPKLQLWSRRNNLELVSGYNCLEICIGPSLRLIIDLITFEPIVGRLCQLLKLRAKTTYDIVIVRDICDIPGLSNYR